MLLFLLPLGRKSINMDFYDDEDIDDMAVKMYVAAIMDVGQSSSYNLVLKEVEGTRHLAMSIGIAEAQSIAVYLERVSLPRPLAHDITVNLLRQLECNVKHIVIEELRQGYFISSIVCEKDGNMFSLDARTSDAVAIALRVSAPIYAKERVLFELNGRPAIKHHRELNELSDEEINKEIERAVEKEDYERAQMLKRELDSRHSAE